MMNNDEMSKLNDPLADVAVNQKHVVARNIILLTYHAVT